MKIIAFIFFAAAFAYCKPAKYATKRIYAYGYYHKGGSLTIRLDSLGVIDSSTAKFVEGIRRALKIDSNNIKYEIRNTQYR